MASHDLEYEDFCEEDEVSIELTQEYLFDEISSKTKVPVDTVKQILLTFIKHQLDTMHL